MADIRTMLRAERVNRRITHPNASYTSDGKLLCNLCEMTVKSEAAWGAHLHSTQHTLRLSRAQEVAASRISEKGKRKRKSSSEGPVDERKRIRGHDGREDGDGEGKEEGEDEAEAVVEDVPVAMNGVQEKSMKREEEADEDAAELAAFEAELAELERSETASKVTVGAGATISAAPMSAEEIAAKAREVQSEQRGRRDDELLADKEDAERLIEEEMEEMEGLEERVRKLKERREALRGEPKTQANGAPPSEVELQKEDGEDESDDADDFDDWHFGSA